MNTSLLEPLEARIAPATLSIVGATISEGDTGEATALFRVRLSERVSGEVTVHYATSDGTATTEGGDYLGQSGTLTFASGSQEEIISVKVLGDLLMEGTETFIVTLDTATGATLQTPQAAGEIIDNDTVPTLSILDAPAIMEGSSGARNAVFEVRLSQKTTQAVTVTATTGTEGTATEDDDFDKKTQTITIPAGQLSAFFNVPVRGDTVNEGDETLTVALSNPMGATIVDGAASGTISNDDRSFSIGDVSIVEGDSGSKTMVFTVVLSSASASEVRVRYATSNGTGERAATAGTDYVSTNGQLTFAAGELEKTFTVSVSGDTMAEFDEGFLVTLSEPTGANPTGDNQANGTIENDDPALSVSDAVVVTEGAGRFAEFVVTMEAGQNFPVVVNFATANGTGNGTAMAGTDYLAKSGSLTFTEDGMQTVRVELLDDNLVEGTETFTLSLTNPAAGSGNPVVIGGAAVGTILDDEAGFTIGDVTITEGDSGTSNAVFVVRRLGAATEAVTVKVSTQADTAAGTGAEADFTPLNGVVLSFAANETAKTVSVPIIGDVRAEAAETFKVLLSEATGAAIRDGEGVGTILDTDPAISVTIDSPRPTEGSAATPGVATFQVRLSSPAAGPVSVKVTTVEGTATAGGDYIFKTETLTFAAGQTVLPFAVTLIGDGIDEADETFSVQLSEATNSHLSDTASATATIVNDERTVSIADVEITEGDASSQTLIFTVSLSAASSHAVTVDFATTTGGTAAATGAFADFVAKMESLTFAPGQTSKTVSVTVTGDTRDEASETVFAKLSNVTGAIFSVDGDEAVGTILDNDAAPQLSVADESVVEGAAPVTGGDDGLQTRNFTIRLSAPSERPISVKVVSQNGTAIAGEDYNAVATMELTFAPGETSKTVGVVIKGDATNEPDEQFSLVLSEGKFTDAAGGTVAFVNDDDRATGTILNDERTVSIANTSLVEGDSGTSEMLFTLTLSAASLHPVTVQFSTADGTALSSGPLADFVAKMESVTFEPGQTTKTVSVTVLGDERNEANETFTGRLTTSTNALISGGTATGTILNDEAILRLVRTNAAGVEIEAANLDEETGQAFFKVVRSGGSASGAVTVQYATENGTALATGPRVDYTAKSATVTLGAGQTETGVFEVLLTGDSRRENNETFRVVLSNATNSSVDPAAGALTFTIQDNDVAPTIAIGDATVVEGDTGTKTLVFTVNLSAADETGEILVDFATNDIAGEARSSGARADYVAQMSVVNPAATPRVDTRLRFGPGETQKTFSVLVNGDLVDEVDNAETFGVTITPADAARITAAGSDFTAIGTIQDNDVATVSISPLAVTEGTGGETPAAVTVRLSHLSETPVSVNVLTFGGTASLTSDLVSPTPSPTTVQFAAVGDGSAGEISKTVTYRIAADSVRESSESFTARLDGAVGAPIGTGEATITINDDDPMPLLTINSVAIAEGDSGTKELVFTVSLSNASQEIVKVNFATSDGTAKSSGPFVDFEALSGALEFLPGAPTQQEIRVPIIGDTVKEATESFTVTLSSAQNAGIQVATGTGTITDSDTVIGVAISDVRVVEGDFGTKVAAFNVVLSGPTTGAITFNATTRSGTALSGTDFVALNNAPITIAAGESSGVVNVSITGDQLFEAGASESFFVTISDLSANARAVDDEARGTIYADDIVQVNARTFRYIDVDGDLATVQVSKGTLRTGRELIFSAVNAIGGRGLQVIDLLGNNDFAGASVSVSAVRQSGFPGGLSGEPSDGVADVGFIRASFVNLETLNFANGIDLARVSVDGDLGRIVVGNLIAPGAIGAINVGSFGLQTVAFPPEYQDGFGETSGALGKVGKLIVRGDFGGDLRVVGDQFGDIGLLRIGGALRGGTEPNSGYVSVTGTLSRAIIGSIVGGTGNGSGTLTGEFNSDSSLGNIRVLGDIVGGGGIGSGEVAAPRIGRVSAEDIIGGAGFRSGLIRSGGSIGSVHLSGEIIGGATGTGGSGEFILSGGVAAQTRIGSVIVEGSLRGGTAANSGSIQAVTGGIGRVQIGEDIVGGAGEGSGSIRAGQNISSLQIGTLVGGARVDGDVIGSTGEGSGAILVSGNLGAARIFGNVLGGSSDGAGSVTVTGDLGRIDIGGNLEGGDSTAAAGSTLANDLVSSGVVSAGQIGRMTLGGDLVAGADNGTGIANSGAIRAAGAIGQLTIKGDVLGNADNPAVISAGGTNGVRAFGNIDLRGDVRFAEILAGYGTAATTAAPRGVAVSADAQIGTVSIRGAIEATSIVAGGSAGTDGEFGTSDDRVITNSPGVSVFDRAGILSRIARIVIGGERVANTGDYGIVAQHIVSLGGSAVLTPGAGNDLAAGSPVLLVTNFRALELPVPARA